MTDIRKPDQVAALANWSYTREEWRTFMLWRKMKKGIFQYVIFWLMPKRNLKVPDIVITREAIAIDNVRVLFSDAGRRLRRINIRDAGKINVLEMTYQKTNNKQPAFTDVFVPVPKGKLREAIELQEIITRDFKP